MLYIYKKPFSKPYEKHSRESAECARNGTRCSSVAIFRAVCVVRFSLLLMIVAGGFFFVHLLDMIFVLCFSMVFSRMFSLFALFSSMFYVLFFFSFFFISLFSLKTELFNVNFRNGSNGPKCRLPSIYCKFFSGLF